MNCMLRLLAPVLTANGKERKTEQKKCDKGKGQGQTDPGEEHMPNFDWGPSMVVFCRLPPSRLIPLNTLPGAKRNSG